jgi:hypothetical protein
MNLKQLNSETDALARRYDYGDSAVLVADLGVSDDAATVDVVDETVILVVDDGDEDRQLELDAPRGDAAEAFINNGVVTVEVER